MSHDIEGARAESDLLRDRARDIEQRLADAISMRDAYQDKVQQQEGAIADLAGRLETARTEKLRESTESEREIARLIRALADGRYNAARLAELEQINAAMVKAHEIRRDDIGELETELKSTTLQRDLLRDRILALKSTLSRALADDRYNAARLAELEQINAAMVKAHEIHRDDIGELEIETQIHDPAARPTEGQDFSSQVNSKLSDHGAIPGNVKIVAADQAGSPIALACA